MDAVSALLTITLWGGIGYWGGNSIQTLRRDITNIEQTVVIVLAILVGSILLLRYCKKGRDTSGKPNLVKKIDYR